MIRVGDTVKVIGTTIVGADTNAEPIKIGTICRVVGYEFAENQGLIVGVVPEKELPYTGHGEFWYTEKDIEKGHMEWVKED